MAGAFARRVGAKRLVLNHFSPRYRGDAHVLSVLTMLRFEAQVTSTHTIEAHLWQCWGTLVGSTWVGSKKLR